MVYGTFAVASADLELDALRAEFEVEVQLFVCRPPRERDHLRERFLRHLPSDLSPDVNAAYAEAMRRGGVLRRNRPFLTSTGAAHAPRGRREARPRKAASSATKEAGDEPPPRRESGPESVDRLAAREGSESFQARRARTLDGLDAGDFAAVVDLFRVLNTWKLER